MRWAGVIFAAGLSLGASAAWGQAATYRFAHSDDPVADRNAYLLTLLETDAGVRKAVAADGDLQRLGARLAGTREAVLAACRAPDKPQAPGTCPVDRLMLSDGEIAAAGEALARLAPSPSGPLSALVRDQMRPSGRFQKYAGLDDAALLRAAWTETAQGVNRLYRVYAAAQPPRYPDIDAMSYAPADRYFRGLERAALEAETDGAGHPFFAPWSRLGFDLLVINQRDEAARYEPLEAGENAAAMARAKTLDWRARPYSAIVVPGQGLEGAEVGLSPGGAFRVRLAAARWREGKAPFILVSGGHVHPNKTAFAEAIQMKRALTLLYGVPADAVVVDPYARHTTTNLRNAVRLMFAMGAPMGRPMLVTTSQDQSLYIEGAGFAARNTAELGYEPMTGFRRLSPFDLAASANLTSLHADPQDPLDP